MMMGLGPSLEQHRSEERKYQGPWWVQARERHSERWTTIAGPFDHLFDAQSFRRTRVEKQVKIVRDPKKGRDARRDQAGPAHQGPAGSGGRHVRKKHWATEAEALRAKRLKADHHQLARGPERLSFTIHAAKGYAVVTYPDRRRRTMTVPEARAIFRAHWRMGFRPLPQHETCECPAYRFPHRRGSGRCGDAMGGRRDRTRRSTRGMSRRQREKIHDVMREYKHGRLRSGSKRGPRVRTREQAVAIAISEARKREHRR